MSVREMLRVLAGSSRRLGSPPQTMRPLCICQTGSPGRPEAGEGGSQSCPCPTQTGASTPGWRRAEGPQAGPCCLFVGTYMAVSRHTRSTPHPSLHTHTHTEACFPNRHQGRGDRCATSVCRKNRGCHRDDRITLDREQKALHLGSLSRWHSGGRGGMNRNSCQMLGHFLFIAFII